MPARRSPPPFRWRSISDTLYPVRFAIPSAVRRDWASGVNSGMAHQTNPWAGVAVAEPLDG